jgi:hypothetical protein
MSEKNKSNPQEKIVVIGIPRVILYALLGSFITNGVQFCKNKNLKDELAYAKKNEIPSGIAIEKNNITQKQAFVMVDTTDNKNPTGVLYNYTPIRDHEGNYYLKRVRLETYPVTYYAPK